MKHISEKWVRGKMISRIESDDGIPDLAEIDARLKIIEARPSAIPVTVAPSQESLPPQEVQQPGLINRILRVIGK